MTEDTSSDDDRITDSVPVLDRSLVLVGLMGAGKSTIGRRLAARLDLPFVDADNEIEAAADCSIQEIFDEHGEDYFRDGERRVIERLLNGPVCVLATGGGAFMNQTTRELIKQKGRSLWLRADIEILVQRPSRRSHRPLLNKGNPREILQDLMDQRYPVYQTADYSVETDDSPHSVVVERALSALTEQRPLDENGTLA